MEQVIDKLAADRLDLTLENARLKSRIKDLELELRCANLAIQLKDEWIEHLYCEMAQEREKGAVTLETVVNNLRAVYSKTI